MFTGRCEFFHGLTLCILTVLFQGRTYLKKKWTQTDGNFGVIIGVTKKKNK
jgi:hypothetical protein